MQNVSSLFAFTVESQITGSFSTALITRFVVSSKFAGSIVFSDVIIFVKKTK